MISRPVWRSMTRMASGERSSSQPRSWMLRWHGRQRTALFDGASISGRRDPPICRGSMWWISRFPEAPHISQRQSVTTSIPVSLAGKLLQHMALSWTPLGLIIIPRSAICQCVMRPE